MFQLLLTVGHCWISHTCVPAQDLGRGFCFGCWTTKGGLQSVCGKCRVGACQKCRALWEDKRKHGATVDESGLMVNQSNICFCGGHLTPRGAAAYDRKVGSVCVCVC